MAPGTGNTIDDNGIIHGPLDNTWDPVIPKGSYYLELRSRLRDQLEQQGDWTWITNCLTGESINAFEVEPLTKK